MFQPICLTGLAGFLSGFIFELSGSYQNAFFVAGGAIAVGTCTLSLIPFFMTDTKVVTVEICEEPLEKEDTVQDKTDTACSAGRQRNSFIYDTSNFAMRRSLSCLALGRLGDVCGSQCILEMLERESDVWSDVKKEKNTYSELLVQFAIFRRERLVQFQNNTSDHKSRIARRVHAIFSVFLIYSTQFCFEQWESVELRMRLLQNWRLPAVSIATLICSLYNSILNMDLSLTN